MVGNSAIAVYCKVDSLIAIIATYSYIYGKMQVCSFEPSQNITLLIIELCISKFLFLSVTERFF